MKRIAIMVMGLFFIFAAVSYASQTVKIFTEEFPPFQYSENGKITGASTEIVEAVMSKSKIAYEVKSLPWARSYSLAQETDNALIFSISRRPNREDLFKWIGIIVPSRYSVFKLKERSDINLTSMEDMKKYKIGTTIDDARESYLVGKGFSLDNFDRISGQNPNAQNYQKLKYKRIDLWPMPDAVAFHIAKSDGDEPNKVIERGLPLTEISKGGYYIAASLKTSDEIVTKIKSELDEFIKSDEYNKILKKWGIE